MKPVALILAAVLLSGCAAFAPRTSGGKSAQEIAPETGAIAQTMEQSDNPATESKQTITEVKETIEPETGKVVERVTRNAETTVGAAQDLSKILKQANRSKDFIGRMATVLALFAGAWLAWKRQWPTVAAVLGVGGLAALQYGTVAAAIAIAASVLVYVAYTIGLKTPNVSLK